MKKKILLITNLFHPDELAGASLYSDFAEYFKTNGYDIRVLTTFSYYPAWKRRDEDKGKFVTEEVWKDIPVRRVPMFIPKRAGGLGRLLSDGSFLISTLIGKTYFGWKPDAVVTAMPMFSQCLTQSLSTTPSLFIIQDFVVDAALELGILKGNFLKKILRTVERKTLQRAKVLTTISTQMVEKLNTITNSTPSARFVPNWIHKELEDEINLQKKENPQREKNSIFYSGNLGVKQGLPDFLEDFLEQRSKSTNLKNWKLLIHGGGAEKERLQNFLNNVSEENKGVITLGPVVENKEYVKKLLSSTVCLVTQKPNVGANFLPSKLLPALAAGCPILAICDIDSPLGKEVSENKTGIVITPGDKQKLEETLKLWEADPNALLEISNNAIKRSNSFSRNEILKVYEEIVNSL
jgi:colanic acid biosynthesis glycosyl transferase WcaI